MFLCFKIYKYAFNGATENVYYNIIVKTSQDWVKVCIVTVIYFHVVPAIT